MTKFIIDQYDKYSSQDRAVARYIFHDLYGTDWAIKEYKYEDGMLVRPQSIYDNENINECFALFDTYEEAYDAVMEQKAHDHQRTRFRYEL